MFGESSTKMENINCENKPCELRNFITVYYDNGNKQYEGESLNYVPNGKGICY